MELFASLFHASQAVGTVTGSILLASAIPPLLWSALSRATVVSASLAGMLVSLAVFLAAFVVTSPYSVWHLNFLKGLREAAQVTAFGHIFKDTDSGVMWFQKLSAPSVLGLTVTVLAVLGLVIAVSHRYSGLGRGRWPRAELVVSLWVLLYLGFLVLRVNLRAPQVAVSFGRSLY